MNVPPLDVIALFSEAVPEGPAIAAATLDPAFEVRRVDEPCEQLSAELEDPFQPLTPAERRAAASARAGLRLRCSSEMQPAAQLPACVERIRLMRDLGAIAIALPAAHKIIGPTALGPALDDLGQQTGWLRLFTHGHVVREQGSVWCHTHGMQHFGLPDVECRTASTGELLVQRLVYGAVAHLMELGGDGLSIGEVLEAIEPDGRALGRFQVREARPVDHHEYGTWGALQIIPIAGIPEGQTLEEHSVDAQSTLRMFIASGQRACDLDLQAADLARSDLSGLSADRLDLSRADLRGAALRSARLGGCRLHGARLEDSDWSEATLRMCALDGAQGAGACFDGARIEDSSAKSADLVGASLRDAKLSETSFERAVLREALAEGAEGEGVDFRGADLSAASLAGARLDDADFRGADLRGADLSRGRFRGADFRGALLEDARFEGADLGGARFDVGEGPGAEAAPESRKESDAKLDQAGAAALREMLAALSATFAAQGVTPPGQVPKELKRLLEPLTKMAAAAPADFFDRLRQGLEQVDAAGTSEPPEAWKPWLEPLMKKTNEGHAPDLEALVEALSSFMAQQPGSKGPER